MSVTGQSLKFSRLIPLLLAVASGALLFMTAQAVQENRAELAEMHEKLARERAAIRVLEAEWAYLDRPQRLERLAKAHLDLQPPMATQVLAPGVPLPTLRQPGLPLVKPGGVQHIQPAAGIPEQGEEKDGNRDVSGKGQFDAVIQDLRQDIGESQ